MTHVKVDPPDQLSHQSTMCLFKARMPVLCMPLSWLHLTKAGVMHVRAKRMLL